MTKNIHANALRLRNKGVLIMGDSGSGKSTLTLALLERASFRGDSHALVGDDYITCSYEGDKIVLNSIPAMAGSIEVRGAGIFHIEAEPKVQLDLCVVLTNHPQRMPQALSFSPTLAVIKKLFLPPISNTSILNQCYAIEFTLFKQAWSGSTV